MQPLFSRVSKNWKSGLAVALVSIPLSISLALAGGATPQMGIITAIWAGLIASFVGGSNFNIVGPTGALSGILASYALLHGVETLPLLALLSGIFILLVFLLKLERFIILIPASVLHGFTLGVAFIIGLGQINSALSLTPGAVHETFLANLVESFRQLPHLDLLVSTVFVFSLIALLAMSVKFPKLPNVVLLSAIGIVLGFLSHEDILPITLPTILTKYGAIPSQIIAWPTFSLQSLRTDSLSGLLSATFAVGVVAILETLISAKIADGMTKTRFNQRREILGLGLANLASGIFGGIPATAALARTSLNVNSGADHKLSATISSLSIAFISLIFLSYFQYLPLSIVAAILVYVAIRMVKAEHFYQLFRFDKWSFFLSLVVAVLTVVWEPIYAIGIGTIIALLAFVNRLAMAHAEVNINDKKNQLLTRLPVSKMSNEQQEGSTIVYRLAGELIYINAESHRHAIEQINDATQTVILSLRNLYYIDLDGVDILAEIVDGLQAKKKKVALSAVNPYVAPLLEKTEWFQLLKKSLIYETTPAALADLALQR